MGTLGAAVLTACGGGSGSSTVEQLSVNGVAAVGAALAGASVELKCASGTPQTGQVTAATGSYRVLLNGARAPCMVEVRGGTVGGAANTLTLHGYAGEAGKANVTTLTELVLARALGASPAAAFSAFDGSAVPSAQALAEALDYVGTQFTALGLGAPSTAVLNGSFVIGQGDDLLIDQLNEKLADAHVDVGALVAATASSSAWTDVVLRSCSSTTLSWAQDGNTCSADVPATASAALVQLTDTQAPTTGSASYTCTNGQWSQPAEAVCSAPPPAPCPAQSVNWSVDGNTCGALLGEAASGVSSAIEDTTAPTTGSATYVCRDGSWGSATNASCAVPSGCNAATGNCPGSDPCTSQAMSWTVNGNTCNATVAGTASGSSTTATDITAPTTGSAVYACSNGTWGSPTSASCNTPLACPAQTVSWTAGDNTCQGTLAGVASGVSSTAIDNTIPTVGSATYACTNGNWGSATTSACTLAPTGPRTFTLNLEADTGGRWYEYVSDTFAEIGQAWDGSAVYDGFFLISQLPAYVKVGGGFDVFPKNGSFGDIGTITYNITGYTGSGTGTFPVTAIAANFTTVIAPKAMVLNLDYATAFSNVSGTVSLYDGQVTGISLTATVTFTYTAASGTTASFSGPFEITGNRFAFTAGSVAAPGERKYRWEFSGQVKNLATTGP